MNEQIKRLNRQLVIAYIAYFAASLLFAAIYELLPEAKGALVGNTNADYALGVVCILLTLLIVPLSIKVFGNLIVKHHSLELKERISRYRMLWNSRIICYAMVTIFNLWSYYATLNNIGGFCALICMAAALLFVPTDKRTRGDLNINE